MSRLALLPLVFRTGQGDHFEFEIASYRFQGREKS